MHEAHYNAMRPHRGFTLIEVMVALVVLSIGMLGVASTFLQSVRLNRDAIYRTQAVYLATDMADRIRANSTALAAYAGAAANNGCAQAPGFANPNNCNPVQMAGHDVFLWQTQIQTLLPQGAGNIQFNNGTNPPTYTINVTWTDVDEGAPVGYTLTVQI